MARNSSGVYICNSVVNDLRHGNYTCKSEGIELPVDGESVLLMQRRCGRAPQGVLRQTQTEQRTWGRVRGRVLGKSSGEESWLRVVGELGEEFWESFGLEFWVSSGKSLGRVLG